MSQRNTFTVWYELLPWIPKSKQGRGGGKGAIFSPVRHTQNLISGRNCPSPLGWCKFEAGCLFSRDCSLRLQARRAHSSCSTGRPTPLLPPLWPGRVHVSIGFFWLIYWSFSYWSKTTWHVLKNFSLAITQHFPFICQNNSDFFHR